MKQQLPARAASSIAFAAIFVGGIGFSHALFAAEPAPWSERAEAAARLFVEANAQQLANSIQHIAHPEGKRPQLSGRDFSSWNDHVRVKIAVSWIRGPGSRHYTTWVAWEFSEKNHLQARVVSDSASTKITAKDSALLDDHFREKIYPGFTRGVRGEIP